MSDELLDGNQVLEWNQIFIDTLTLIATNTPNSSSQRLGAIVHTAIFDAYNCIERRALDASYRASLAALSDDGEDGGKSRERGLKLGMEVANVSAGLACGRWFSGSYPAFTAGTAVGQWRPTPPASR